MRAEFNQEVSVTRAPDDHGFIALAEGIDETGTTLALHGIG